MVDENDAAERGVSRTSDAQASDPNPDPTRTPTPALTAAPPPGGGGGKRVASPLVCMFPPLRTDLLPPSNLHLSPMHML